MHLVHPALLHFSVAFLIVGGLVEALGILRKKPEAERFGAILFLAGVGSLVPTVASGFLAANSVDLPSGAASVLDRHEALGLVLLGVSMALALWKAWGRGTIAAPQRTAFAVALLVAVGLTVLTAFFGGALVYGEGVGTGGRNAPATTVPGSP